MENHIKELNNLFNDIQKEKDYHKFFSNLTTYFQYIHRNYPLEDITKNIFEFPPLVVIKNIQKSYEQIINHKPTAMDASLDPLSINSSGLSAFHRELINKLDTKEKNIRVITRNVEGDYFYMDKKLPFRQKSIYYHVFDFLFNLPDMRASYKNIDKHLGKMGFGVKKSDDAKKQRIQNAIKVYEKNARHVKEISGNPIFETEYGFGVKLNIPYLRK